jgi:hypothetical protein
MRARGPKEWARSCAVDAETVMMVNDWVREQRRTIQDELSSHARQRGTRLASFGLLAIFDSPARNKAGEKEEGSGTEGNLAKCRSVENELHERRTGLDAESVESVADPQDGHHKERSYHHNWAEVPPRSLPVRWTPPNAPIHRLNQTPNQKEKQSDCSNPRLLHAG